MWDSRVKKGLDKVQSAIERTVKYMSSFITAPEMGTLVIAPYEQNNCRAYFRGVVEGHVSSPEVLVQIFFIDFGYSSECRLCDIRCINNDSDITDIPSLSFECALANIQPALTNTLKDTWSDGAYDFFWRQINKSSQLFGDIYSVVNSVVALELIYKDGEEEISINQILIDKGFAIKREPDYFSRFNNSLRLCQEDLSDEQCAHYEKLQYSQDFMPDVYPDAPDASECYRTVNLRGPFSPLEIDLKHLTAAGRDKRVNMATNSVNSVLLDTDPDDLHQRLLVASSVSQNVHGSNLTLFNTTLMPRIPGLAAFIALIFTPCTE